MQPQPLFEDLRREAQSAIEKCIAEYEERAKRAAPRPDHVILSPGFGPKEPTYVSRSSVLATDFTIILQNDQSLTPDARVETHDLSISIHQNLEGQLFRNMVSSVNDLLVVGTSKTDYFELRPVSRRGDEPETKAPPKFLHLFLRGYLKSIRDQICAGSAQSSSKGAFGAGVIASMAGSITHYFGVDHQLATGIAAGVVLVVLKAGRDGLCAMADDEILARLGEKQPPKDQ